MSLIVLKLLLKDKRRFSRQDAKAPRTAGYVWRCAPNNKGTSRAKAQRRQERLGMCGAARQKTRTILAQRRKDAKNCWGFVGASHQNDISRFGPFAFSRASGWKNSFSWRLGVFARDKFFCSCFPARQRGHESFFVVVFLGVLAPLREITFFEAACPQ
jgi:hypothetical protein